MEKPKKEPTALREFWNIVSRLWVIVTAVIGSLLVVVILFAAFALRGSSSELPEHTVSQRVISRNGDDKVAVLYLSGPIVEATEEAGFGSSGVIASEKVLRVLDAVQQDDDVKAVVVRINSPGGAVVPSDELYRKLVELRNEKPVVISMGSMAASGGYYIAAGGNKIVANPATLTGSIGVIAQLPKVSGLYDKLGIEMRVIKTGKFKDIGSPNRDITPEENQLLEALLTESYEQFIDAIVTGRNIDEAKLREVADGRILSGEQAKRLGLVDELGDFHKAVSVAEELADISNASVVEYSSESFWEALLQSKSSLVPQLNGLDILPQQKFGLYYMVSVGE